MSKPKDPKKLTLTDINSRFNPNVIVPNKIRAALREIGNAAVTEDVLRSMAGIGSNQLSQYADQFEEYHVIAREGGRSKRLWAGTPKFAQEAREMLNK